MGPLILTIILMIILTMILMTFDENAENPYSYSSQYLYNHQSFYGLVSIHVFSFVPIHVLHSVNVQTKLTPARFRRRWCRILVTPLAAKYNHPLCKFAKEEGMPVFRSSVMLLAPRGGELFDEFAGRVIF